MIIKEGVLELIVVSIEVIQRMFNSGGVSGCDREDV